MAVLSFVHYIFSKFHFSLRSNLFKADDIVGESKDGLVKTEMFNGNSFDKQFNLRFHQKFNGGPFGKVFVDSKDQQENVTQVLDFNLEKVSFNIWSFYYLAKKQNL